MDIPYFLLQLPFLFIQFKQIIFNKGFHIKILLMSSHCVSRLWDEWDGRVFIYPKWLLCLWSSFWLAWLLYFFHFICWTTSTVSWELSFSQFLQTSLFLFLKRILWWLCYPFFGSWSISIIIMNWVYSGHFWLWNFLCTLYSFYFIFAVISCLLNWAYTFIYWVHFLCNCCICWWKVWFSFFLNWFITGRKLLRYWLQLFFWTSILCSALLG